VTKVAFNRRRRLVVRRRTSPSTKFLLDNDIDLLAGHMPIGVHRYWHQAAQWQQQEERLSNITAVRQNQNDNVLYVTFFREAVAKFVSGVVYRKAESGELQRMTQDDVAKHIVDSVRQDRRHKKYGDGYSSYLLTPEQKEELLVNRMNKNDAVSMDLKLQMMAENLVTLPAVIGIVENMTSSIDLISKAIDPSNEARKILRAPDESTTNANGGIRANEGKMSTGRIIELLKQHGNDDGEFYRTDLLEYVKYDDALYRFAVKLHEMQVSGLSSAAKTAAETKQVN